ncbi:gluconokinase [Flagellimonas flava]|uniref:Gluconokinase n=1 Tax=Flagellimonas flava TaxID=570519 RepID=A0A1M5IAD9_9FLAO|nr:gluconokinase [Allomuricauda flava]SHG25039.1 gluconokinase [Allomuricauda flava]
MNKQPTVLIIMGVSGTGKSTIGTKLSERLDFPFFDGDDYHPEENVQKMSAGNPLNDEDRKGWLERLNQLALEHKSTGAIIACSALKESYRDLLSKQMGTTLQFVHLDGSFDLITSRLKARKGHFMTAALLQSQFDTLEPPKDAIIVSIELTPEEIVSSVLRQLG